ncbi:hypothetical protein, partial [Rheinheimera sp.]|uniref:hypothetical protein n=1 Tax=Rheinheimera sp. TaxID=1869214 RepID=UPI004047D2A7
MSYITINNYFQTIGGFPKSDTLVQPSAKSPAANVYEQLATFSNYPEGSLIAGTITLGYKKYYKMSYQEQLYQIQKAFKNFNKKSITYIAFIEDTKNGVP